MLGQRLIQVVQSSHDVLFWCKELEEEEEEEKKIHARVQPPRTQAQAVRLQLLDYFWLREDGSMDLQDMYALWSAADPMHFAHIAPVFPGVRLLRQDPFECLFSFICSSNNNIKRIALMLDKLCAALGNPVPVPASRPAISLQGHPIQCMYSFPTPEALLAASVEQGEGTALHSTLEGLGFGYRAKFVVAALDTLWQYATDHNSIPMSDSPIPCYERRRGTDAPHPIRVLLQQLRDHADVEAVLSLLQSLKGECILCGICMSSLL